MGKFIHCKLGFMLFCLVCLNLENSLILVRANSMILIRLTELEQEIEPCYVNEKNLQKFEPSKSQQKIEN